MSRPLTFVCPAYDPLGDRALYALAPDGYVLRAFFPAPGAEPEFARAEAGPADDGDYRHMAPPYTDWEPLTAADLGRYGLAR